MKKVNNQDSVNIISNVYHRPNQENWPDGYNHRYGQKSKSKSSRMKTPRGLKMVSQKE